jgi:uncharacterized Zn finger protein
MKGRSLTREDVIRAFGAKEFQKGLVYLVEGRVASAIEDGDILRGSVKGTMDRLYDVKFEIPFFLCIL